MPTFKGGLLASFLAIYSMSSAWAGGPEHVTLVKQARANYLQAASTMPVPPENDPHLATLMHTLLTHFAVDSPHTWENFQTAFTTLQASHPELLPLLQKALHHILETLQGILNGDAEETFNVKLLTNTAQTISQQITRILSMENIQTALTSTSSSAPAKPTRKKTLQSVNSASSEETSASCASAAPAAPIDHGQLAFGREYRKLTTALQTAYQGADVGPKQHATVNLATFIFHRKLIDWLKSNHISAKLLIALLNARYKKDGTGIQLVWAQIVAKLKI